MPKRQIIEVNDSFADQDEWVLEYTDDWNATYLEEGTGKRSHPSLTLEELADFCDRNAESRNNHTFVGTHRILAALLYKEVGREQATHLLHEIASYGGLDGMSGIRGEADAFADFGIKDCWSDWKLPA